MLPSAVSNPDELTFLVERDRSGEYIARALGPPIFVVASTLDALRVKVPEAVRAYFAPGPAPATIRLKFMADAAD